MSLNKLLKLTSTYMLGEILIMAGGFISFPIFTRILTKGEYGTMNLIAITLSFVEVLSTVGLRHASQRYYPEYSKKGLLPQFYSTTIRNSLKFGLLGTLVVAIVSTTCSKLGLFPADIGSLFAVASILVFIRIISKISGCLYRVCNQAITYTLFAVTEKYAGMLLSVFFVAYLTKGLFGYYWGLLLGESLTLLVYLVYLLRDFGFPKHKSSPAMFRVMSSYGMPMIISGFAGTILSMGDRYLIGYFLGTEAVAIYSVPYNLCSYITGILVTAFEFAFVPLIMTEWAKPGHGQTDLQLQQAIKMYCLIALPIICGVIVLGKEFISVVASTQYLASANILPYVIIGEMIKGLLTPFIIGLQFYKQTVVMTKITWCAALLNIVLNLALIPLIGLLGSALATLISYLFLMGAGAYVSSKFYRVIIPWMSIGRYFGCSLGMILAVSVLKVQYPNTGLLLLIIVSVVLFFSLIFLCDREIRTKVQSYI